MTYCTVAQLGAYFVVGSRLIFSLCRIDQVEDTMDSLTRVLLVYLTSRFTCGQLILHFHHLRTSASDQAFQSWFSDAPHFTAFCATLRVTTSRRVEGFFIQGVVLHIVGIFLRYLDHKTQKADIQSIQIHPAPWSFGNISGSVCYFNIFYKLLLKLASFSSSSLSFRL
jgi:hypothetical protein